MQGCANHWADSDPPTLQTPWVNQKSNPPLTTMEEAALLENPSSSKMKPTWPPPPTFWSKTKLLCPTAVTTNLILEIFTAPRVLKLPRRSGCAGPAMEPSGEY